MAMYPNERKVVVDFREEINEYVGETPESEWDIPGEPGSNPKEILWSAVMQVDDCSDESDPSEWLVFETPDNRDANRYDNGPDRFYLRVVHRLTNELFVYLRPNSNPRYTIDRYDLINRVMHIWLKPHANKPPSSNSASGQARFTLPPRT